MPVEAVINAKDVPSIYEVPLQFAAEGLDEILLDLLSLPHYDRDLSKWESLVNRIKNPAGEVDIAVVGKYVDYGDSYKSLNEALAHGGIANNVKVKLHYVDAETLENDQYPDVLFRADAILVPGGFGQRGVEGMMKAIRTRARRRSRSSGSAWASRRPSSSTRATSPGSRTPTRRSSTRSPSTRSSSSCAT